MPAPDTPNRIPYMVAGAGLSGRRHGVPDARRRLAAWLARAVMALLTGLFVIGAAHAGPAASARLPEPFSATYAVSYGQRSIGDLTITVRPAPGGDGGPRTWLLDSSSSPRGLARLLGKPTESSRFEFGDDGPRPLEFNADGGNRRSKGDARVEFDWAAGVAISHYEDEPPQEIPIERGVLDRALVTVSLMYDFLNGRRPEGYTTVDKNSLRRYDVEVLGEETITVEAGEFPTIKLRQQREGSSRETFYWVAPGLDYLIVSMKQFKEDKLKIATELARHASGEDAPGEAGAKAGDDA